MDAVTRTRGSDWPRVTRGTGAQGCCALGHGARVFLRSWSTAATITHTLHSGQSPEAGSLGCCFRRSNLRPGSRAGLPSVPGEDIGGNSLAAVNSFSALGPGVSPGLLHYVTCCMSLAESLHHLSLSVFICKMGVMWEPPWGLCGD